jgi:hypothetical protein
MANEPNKTMIVITLLQRELSLETVQVVVTIHSGLFQESVTLQVSMTVHTIVAWLIEKLSSAGMSSLIIGMGELCGNEETYPDLADQETF